MREAVRDERRELSLADLRGQLWDLAHERGLGCTARVAAGLAESAGASGKPRLEVALVYFSAELQRLDDDPGAALATARRGRALAVRLGDEDVTELYDELLTELSTTG